MRRKVMVSQLQVDDLVMVEGRIAAVVRVRPPEPFIGEPSILWTVSTVWMKGGGGTVIAIPGDGFLEKA